MVTAVVNHHSCSWCFAWHGFLPAPFSGIPPLSNYTNENAARWSPQQYTSMRKFWHDLPDSWTTGCPRFDHLVRSGDRLLRQCLERGHLPFFHWRSPCEALSNAEQSQSMLQSWFLKACSSMVNDVEQSVPSLSACPNSLEEIKKQNPGPGDPAHGPPCETPESWSLSARPSLHG